MDGEDGEEPLSHAKKNKKTCFSHAVKVAWLRVDDSFVFVFFSWTSRISKKISISLCCPLD